MVDIQTISIAIGSIGVFVAAIYYIYQIRHQDKMRRLDLFMRIYSIWGSREMLDAHRRFMVIQVESYDSFVNKYGQVTESKQINTDIDQIGWFFNLMGYMVKEKVVHWKVVDELLGYWVIRNWETIKPLVYGWRKQYNIPESYHWFECLYNVMKEKKKS